MNTEFARDNNFSKVYTLRDVTGLIDKNMVGESIKKMKKGNTAGPSGLLSEMVIQAVANVVTELINQILVQGTIPA